MSCQTCRDEQPTSSRYCAPMRCYCGHPACPAFASYEEPSRLATVTNIKPADERMAASWAEREEPTWLDR